MLKLSILIVLITAPALKINNSLAFQSDISKPTTELLDLNELTDFKMLGVITPANQGPYLISGYRHKYCPGSIALMPLYRNAEGGHILSQIIDSNSVSYGVIFNGKIHEKLPQFSYSIQKLFAGAHRILRLSYPNSAPIAFAEQGHCSMAKTLKNYPFKVATSVAE